MLLTELYELRALLSEAALVSEEANEGKKKLDAIVAIIMNMPGSENNASYPKPKLRRG